MLKQRHDIVINT